LAPIARAEEPASANTGGSPDTNQPADKDSHPGPWDGVFTAEQRAHLTPLFQSYLCMSTDPPPECIQPAAQAADEDIAAAGGVTLAETKAWAALKNLWPNITGTPEQIALIQLRAERREDPEAFEMLGYLYQRGIGLPKDSVLAFKDYRHAYDLGRKGNGPALAEVWRSLTTAQKKELNVWLKAEDGDANSAKGRTLGPPHSASGGG
jgi:TPR repeat protein